MKNTTVRLSGRGGLLSHNLLISDKNLTSSYSKFFKENMRFTNSNEALALAFQEENFMVIHGDNLEEGFRLLEHRLNAGNEYKQRQAALRAHDRAENERRRQMREADALKNSENAFKERFQEMP
ncbi:hypothetical protein [Photobacterium halotolerans]|uniref:Uncharacterized protein n=1 Tax=Photobacterium halotolerans TaxID=265726 RepID=A0A0F5VAU9_9GAMM|nr:hypothetical protein [Photobacterium halotolerans]KKC98614.1 hypothetical protein KY46_17840 [Photobacterium halotolerans]